MKWILTITAALLVISVGSADVAFAQIPQYQAGPSTGGGGPRLKRSTRPVVSSYAGLLGAGVGANSGIGYQYFTRVQPQIAASRAIGNLNNSFNRLQAQSMAANGMTSLTSEQQLLNQPLGLRGGIGPTGHAVGYMSQGAYFGTNNSRNSAGGGSGSSAASTNPAVPVRR